MEVQLQHKNIKDSYRLLKGKWPDTCHLKSNKLTNRPLAIVMHTIPPFVNPATAKLLLGLLFLLGKKE
jgi:hypothetical protein